MKVILLIYVFIACAAITSGGIVIGMTYQKSKDKPTFKIRDYQVEVDNDSIYFFDGDREVGSAKWDSSAISNLLLHDNQ